jgi:hypothetical protein
VVELGGFGLVLYGSGLFIIFANIFRTIRLEYACLATSSLLLGD